MPTWSICYSIKMRLPWLFKEAYEGAAAMAPNWFTDNKPNSGVLGVINSISADVASASVDISARPGSTIAAHTEHLH